MGIKTVPQPPYSPDLAACDFWLFPKLRGLSLWDNWGDERGCDEGHWHAHTRGLPWGLPEDVGTVQQVHCSRRRLLWRGLEFHMRTINKSAHTKKNLETYHVHLVNHLKKTFYLFPSLSFSLWLTPIKAWYIKHTNRIKQYTWCIQKLLKLYLLKHKSTMTYSFFFK